MSESKALLTDLQSRIAEKEPVYVSKISTTSFLDQIQQRYPGARLIENEQCAKYCLIPTSHSFSCVANFIGLLVSVSIKDLPISKQVSYPTKTLMYYEPKNKEKYWF